MICAIVLAAGCSRRMGAQKVLLPFGEKTILSHIVDRLFATKVKNIYIVAGYQAKKIEKELSGSQISIIYNSRYESGMLSSVRAGLCGLPKECKAVLVALGDQPSISSKLIDEMIQSFFIKKKKIIVPLYNGKRGHPILFSIIYKNEIINNFDEVGLRGLLQAHDSDVYEMNVSDPSVLMDMDYPNDYKREIETYESRDKQ